MHEGRAALPVTALLALATGAAALRRQAVVARRRYGQVPPEPGPVDLVVSPDSAPVGSPLLLAALGDSGMAGVGVDSVDAALPVQLARRVTQATGRTVRIVSAARTGARTADVLNQVGPLFLTRHDAMSLDAFHPSGTGYGMIADALLPAVLAAVDPQSLQPHPSRAQGGTA